MVFVWRVWFATKLTIRHLYVYGQGWGAQVERTIAVQTSHHSYFYAPVNVDRGSMNTCV